MLSIGELAKRTGVKVATIRYYEQMGLIAAPDRSEGNQRRYEKTDLDRLSFIRHARDLGLTIEAIRDLLALSAHPEKPCGEADRIAADTCVMCAPRSRNCASWNRSWNASFHLQRPYGWRLLCDPRAFGS